MRLMVCLLILFSTLLCSCASIDAAQKPDPRQPSAVQNEAPGTVSVPLPPVQPALPPAVLPTSDALILKPFWKKGDIQKFWIVQNLKVTNGATVLLDSEKTETGIFNVLDLAPGSFMIQWLDSEIQQVRGAKNPLEGKIANTLENTKIMFRSDEKGQITSLENHQTLKTTSEENLKRLASIIGTNQRVQTLMDQFRARMSTTETAFDMLAHDVRSIYALMGAKINPKGTTQIEGVLSKVHSGSLIAGKGILEVKSYDAPTGEMSLRVTQSLDADKASLWMIETLAEVAKTSKTAAPDAAAIRKDFSLTDTADYTLNFKTGKVSKVFLERIMKSGAFVQREVFQADLLKK